MTRKPGEQRNVDGAPAAPSSKAPLHRRRRRWRKGPSTLLAILFAITIVVPSVSVAAPRRIVSLKPNITEILFAIGAGDRVVGVTTYCDYPAEARKLPRVADYVKPFAEKIIALAPDLIIGSEENSSKKSIHTLRRMGFEVRLFSFATIAETLTSIERIGALVGVPHRAAELAGAMEVELNAIHKRYASERSTRVLVVWGHRPLVVTGEGAFMDELIELVGAVNVSSRGTLRYPHWNAESVIAANPDVIIDMAMGTESTDHELWSRLATVSAVRNQHIHTLDDSLFRAGPRLPQAARALANAVFQRSPRPRGAFEQGAAAPAQKGSRASPATVLKR